MVSCCDDDGQHKRRIHDAQDGEEGLPSLGQTLFARGETTTEQARMVHEDGADAEGVAKVQRGEGGKLVEELVGSVDGLSILTTDSVEEAKLFGEESGRHAWIGCEDDEAEEVGEGHHATSGSELGMGGSCVVVPGKEAEENEQL